MESVPLVPPYIESLRPYEAGRTIECVRKQYGLEPHRQAGLQRKSAGRVAQGDRGDDARSHAG